jgi:hypothetical protein
VLAPGFVRLVAGRVDFVLVVRETSTWPDRLARLVSHKMLSRRTVPDRHVQALAGGKTKEGVTRAADREEKQKLRTTIRPRKVRVGMGVERYPDDA